MRCFDWSRRIVLAAAAIAAAAGCKGPDPTGFSCSSSAECPGGYHCDLGTAAAAGSMKCANGAPAQKTLTADATKFLLIKAPSADGAIRTTIEASLGAVAATPDFVGVRVIASQGGTDLGSSQV
ncbi:MAG TPA: hypothetical protein VEP66_10110, partial [Myxococcales bacterium]|nr:hypothetical protein [Myxococcales bacterium]